MASTYVNDLRLNEMATGDASGTWGTVTNTNLELIGEALGYGTEGITTNADTHTTTVADGATDPGRAMYIEYTGTLDSACTITIAPNTLNRMHFIENGTSGSQNIIIKQGSGATITIPPGDTKAVYLDGAGSGAAVVDAFASLSVVDLKVQDDLTVTDDLIVGGDIDLEGAIDVNGTANLDVVDIDGAVDMASTLQVDGAITNGSTIVSTGKITADAGIDIDNFNIDGTTLALSSGDMTIDIAGNIQLDADDNGEVRFLDGGTHFATIKKDGNNALFQSIVADGDFIIQGIDDSSFISALIFDMSAAGAATFNSTITMPSGGALRFGERGNLTHDASSYDMTFNTNGLSNTLVITGDGKIGKGTTNPAVDLDISSSQPNINLTDSDNARIAQLSGSAGDLYLRADTGNGAGSSKIILEIDGSEKARMDADGRTGFGTTTTGNGKLTVQETSTGSSGILVLNNASTVNSSITPLMQMQFNGDSSLGTGSRFIAFANQNDFIGSITGAPSNVAYNTSSDRNLKENIVDASSQLDIVKAIQIREFDWKKDSHHDLGVIAQELYEVIPNIVTEGSETPDADGFVMPWSVDYGKLTPYLTQAIQEQQKLIESLTARITTLEG